MLGLDMYNARSFFADVEASFTEPVYQVHEEGPSVNICIVITAGRVGAEGLIVNVTSIFSDGKIQMCRRHTHFHTRTYQLL